MPLPVYDLQFDDWNEDELARHSVSAREVLQVLDGDPVFFRNKKRHAAQLLMVGPTLGGRMLTVPLAATEIGGVWRPATGWESDADETARYHAARGRRLR